MLKLIAFTFSVKNWLKVSIKVMKFWLVKYASLFISLFITSMTLLETPKWICAKISEIPNNIDIFASLVSSSEVAFGFSPSSPSFFSSSSFLISIGFLFSWTIKFSINIFLFATSFKAASGQSVNDKHVVWSIILGYFLT